MRTIGIILTIGIGLGFFGTLYLIYKGLKALGFPWEGEPS